MNQESQETRTMSYWQETREYFKEKTEVFKEVKKRRHIEMMKEELERELIKYNLNKNKNRN
jgi:signal recognition particle GTPase